ncbi:virulence protein, partial [Salmonella enterica subsp. enterica serovar Offa]|nr:virulence protein [Salmonella enterica subsp. enterica serovar Offa]
EHFYLPVVFSNTLLTGAMTVIRDTHDCVITQQKDAAELTTTAEYDWRFLTPIRVIDVNDNIQAVTMDALGRVTTLRFCGTESGVITGYSDAKMDIPESAEAALAFVAPLPVTQCIVYVTDSWVRPGAEKLPPHVVTLSTDRYDSDNKQQIR